MNNFLTKSLQLFLVLSTVFAVNVRSNTSSFTLAAEVTRNSTINLSTEFISKYIRNLEIYPKYFPNIVSVIKLEDKQSEWIYKVEAPFASPYNVKFILEDKSPASDTLLLESIDTVRDYLYCNAVLSKVSENKTRVSFLFKISMTRENASDIHFLAGILGEKFLSEKMKERLESDLEDFISDAVKDMYISHRTSGNN